MQTLSSRRRWQASVAGALALSGALLTGIAAAQPPLPPPPGTGDAGHCPPPPTAAQLTELSARFAADLAAALGQAPANVERALQEVERQFTGPFLPAVEPGPYAVDDDRAALTSAAAHLGVTPQELADALRGAMPASVCTQFALAGPGALTAISDVAIEIDMAPLFADVAQRLGRGITATRVEAALMLVQPVAEHRSLPEPVSIGGHLQALAGTLGVTVDQLKAALQSVSRGGIILIRGPRTP